MATIEDADFLTSPSKQLRAVQELATLRTRIVDLETELLARRQERRELLQRLTERDLTEQRREGSGRASRTAASQRVRASDEMRQFDANVRSLQERIRRLDIDVERYRLSLEIAAVARGATGDGGARRLAIGA